MLIAFFPLLQEKKSILLKCFENTFDCRCTVNNRRPCWPHQRLMGRNLCRSAEWKTSTLKAPLPHRLLVPVLLFFPVFRKILGKNCHFSSHQISKNLFFTSLSFSFDGLSHHSKCRPLAGMWARHMCKPNGLCLEQQQMNNEIQQPDEKKKKNYKDYFFHECFN